ncbi:MAG TPA: transglycosylase domain-containing protein [Gammaproteobacteria bacterium]|nr:transglycosylase domain-containing protein [Gammaproteobacteria bacterium]
MSFDKAKILKFGLIAGGIATVLMMLLVLTGWLILSRQLPAVDLLKDVQLQQALRVYSNDGKLIAEYGEKRRIPLPIEEIPQVVKDAFLASEDDRFYEHPGVDWQGLARAVLNQLLTGDKSQGGSTITMQVARNFFLSPEKSYKRKISEILLALRIEKEMSKDKILELYLNKIYFGKRAYGIAAAAQVYYGKRVEELSLPQVAMIAGLPKAPSRYNPVVNPERATLRRNYVLRRMLELEKIPQEAYDAAITEPVTTAMFEMPAELDAPYIGEMVRAELVERFGESIYTSGLRIYTTVDSRLQQAANQALRNGLLDYDRRHGYRGPIKQLPLPKGMTEIALTEVDEAALAAEAAAKEAEETGDEEGDEASLQHGLIERQQSQEPKSSWSFRDIDRELETIGRSGDVLPALVTRFVTLPEPPAEKGKPKVAPESLQAAEVYLGAHQYGQLGFEQVKWAKAFVSTDVQGPEPKSIGEVLKVGDYVWVMRRGSDWTLVQMPQVEGAIVSLDPRSGALLALAGGFDFYRSKFNRAVQARRQPGSNFKPFVYAAALDHGFTAASIINDAPVVFDDPALEGKWRPENYSGEFFGPTRLREGLVKSRNLVSIRLLQELGIERARRYVRKFGFNDESLPKDLSLALGSGTETPLEMARGFAAFANDGYLITPFFIDRIETADGKPLWLADYKLACVKCFVEKIDPGLLAEGYEVEFPPEESVPGKTEAPAVATEAVVNPVTATPAPAAQPQTDGMEVIARVLARSREPGIGAPAAESSDPQAETPAVPGETPTPTETPADEIAKELSPPKRRVMPAERIVEPEVAYIMNSMLRDVIQRGTGVRARVLGRNDLAGKTGTSNDQYDAWFSGFNHRYVTTTWLGFDGFQPLGAGEAGAAASLPIWIDYMKVALEGVPEELTPQPEGIVSMRIDADTGLLAGKNTREAIFEIFRQDTAPTEESAGVAGIDPFATPGEGAAPDSKGEPATSELF